MTRLVKTLMIILIVTSCSEKPFNELSESKKKDIITKNIKSYYDNNENKIELKNYNFLLTQSNKLKPCITEPLNDLKILFRKEIYAGSSLTSLSSYEYLDDDKEFGEIETYGIDFKIDDKTGQIKGMESHINFTKWDDGEIGARNSLGSEIKSYEDGKVIDIKKTYLNKELLQKVNKFYESEMKQKQEENKSKCN